MMECRHCGTPIPEGGRFCPSCGKRGDGLKTCPACLESIPEESVFCTYCGKRLDGKTVCANCGTAYQGNFCPACGVAAQGTSASVPAAPVSSAPAAEKARLGWRSILDIVKSSVFLFGLLSMLICCFFVGITVRGEIPSSMNLNVSSNSNAFSYLIVQFTDFADMIKTLEASGKEVYAEFYWGNLSVMIFDALVVLANIVIVVTSSILAAIKFCKNIGRGEVRIGKYFALSAASFFFTAVYLLGETAGIASMVNQELSSYLGTYGFISIVASGGSVAGLVLIGITLVAGLACHIAAHTREVLSRQLISFIFCIILLFLLGIAVILCSGKAFGADRIAVSLRMIVSVMFSEAGILSQVSQELSDVLVKLYCAFILNTVVCAVLFAALTKLAYRFAEGKAPRGASFAFCLSLLILSVIGIILDFVTLAATTDMGSIASITAEPIAGAVFLLFACVASGIYLALKDKGGSGGTQPPAETALAGGERI